MSEESQVMLAVMADIIEELSQSTDGDRVISGLATLAAKMKNGFIEKGFSMEDAQNLTCSLLGAIARAD